MKRILLVALLSAAVGCDRHGLVDISDKVQLDIRYATTNNLTKQQLYWEARCFLRVETARKLRQATEDLRAQGLALKVFDCYRPLSVQRKLWEILPDERYVADPAKGSRHNRGAAVDVTLVDSVTGIELWMPTPYDDFSDRAHRSYTDLQPEPIANRTKLEQVMARNGFVGLPTEWWHFDDADWEKYPVLDIDFKELGDGPGQFGRRYP